MNLATEVKMGIYRHYKGALYQVIGVAHDANANELLHVSGFQEQSDEWWHDLGSTVTLPILKSRSVVVYMPLELNGAHLGPRMAVRTLEDFTAWLHMDHTACNHYADGGKKACLVEPRFAYLGQELTEDMIRAR